MNLIEKVMTSRSSTTKVVVAVAALVVVMWLAGSPASSLWITPVLILGAWTVGQLWLHRRHHPRT